MPKVSGQEVQEAIEITLVPGVGSLGQRKLLEAFPDRSEVFTAPVARLTGMGIPLPGAEALAARRYKPMAEEIADWCRREGCRLLVAGSEDYPARLQDIYDPPTVLYAKGDPACLGAPCVAIVGTRRPTPYGLQVAEGLAEDLARRGVTIISGLARGIDAAAHRGCLAAKGTTAAVLGCGIDVVYPREHRRLTDRILQRGSILTEFPPGTSPAPQNFPVRNRIISGLGIGVLIVEASEYSGSLITARLAMEQNREVFAVPGNLTSPQSFGPNYLIKQGAKLVQSWRDVVEEFVPELRSEILAREVRPCAMIQGRLDLLAEEERHVLGVLKTDRAAQFDRILADSGVGVSRLSDLLFSLEMRGWVRQLPGNLYVRLARPVE
ncbi:MAG: DNA-protecting protein DprA [Acidobacteria bacterium]|nr:DNA-protecting protein DprA [Acidobacteriota bacterium]